jgi:hypothetical protein
VLRVAFTSQTLRGKLADLVSLLSGRNFKTREYLEEIARDSYEKLHTGVMKFVNQTNYNRYIMIVKSTGIINGSLIRSVNVLNFGYALYLLLRDKGYPAGDIETIVRKWIILSILTGRYSGSAESNFDYDIKRFNENDPKEYLETVEKGGLSDAFWENNLPERLNTSVSSSPYFKIFQIAQVKDEDKGFLSKNITVRALIENKGDIHHLFPKKYLQNHGYTTNQYNQIANYAITQSEVNIAISADAPNVYMAKVLKQIEDKKPVIGAITNMDELKDSLKRNCIPENFAEYDISDYMTFLEERRKLMAKKIRDYYENLS